MENAEYRNIFENEETNFYYVATHALTIALVRRHFPMKKGSMILDAGCGTGMLAKKLSSLGKVAAVDVSGQAVSFARQRGVAVRKASIMNLPYPTDTFDVITCVDVLYHRRVHDIRALRELYRVLKPGGFMVVRVPAIEWLRIAHDEVVHTWHRYQKRELREKLTAAGFTVDKLSYSGFVLLPFRIVQKLYESLFPLKKARSIVTPLPFLINWVITAILRIEHWFVLRINLPIGIGLLAIVSK